MNYKTTWFSKRDLQRLCQSVANLCDIELTAEMLCDQINGEVAEGGYGANIEAKLVRKGLVQERAEMLLSDLAASQADDMYTTAKAAEKLGISEIRVRQLCQQGRLGRKVGRDWVISLDEINDYRRKREAQARKNEPAYEKKDDWGGYTVRKSAKGFIVDCWSARQGEITDDRYLVGYGEYGPDADLSSRHNDWLTIGDYIYGVACDPAIGDVKVRTLRKGRIVR